MLEIASAIGGLGYIVLARFQRAEAWVFWLLSSVGYLVVFWMNELYGQSALQLFFVASAFYGYWCWRRIALHQNATSEGSSIAQLSREMRLLSLGAGSLGAAGGGALIFLQTAQLSSFIDAGLASFSVVATMLAAKKYLECWHYWIGINSVATIFFVTQGLHATAFLYATYCLFSVWAFTGWRKAIGR